MRLSISEQILLVPVLALVWQAADVWACAACSGSTPEPVRQAYNYSTAWLSFIPLIFMGSVAFAIYRVIKRGQTKEQQ